MRIGEVRPVPVPDSDVVLLVKMAWAEKRKAGALVAELEEIEKKQGDAKAGERSLAAVDSMLCDYVVGIEGLEDELGNAISRFTPEVLGKCDAGFVMAAFGAMMGSGKAIL
jgi:hypothetical protein